MSHIGPVDPKRISYAGECQGRSVYLYSDGTYRQEGMFGQATVVPCKYCGGWTPFHGTKQCNGCWEVSSRLRDFLRAKSARMYVRRLLKEVEGR